MNKEQIFVRFAKYARSDEHYYNFGTYGVIEDMLAWFDISSDRFTGASCVVHTNNLEKLHNFILNQATDEQLRFIYNISKGQTMPEKSSICDAYGKVFVSMPMNKDKCKYVDVIRNGIDNALIDTNNIAYFLDKDAHNDNIYTKMISEIESCKFLIADLTSQNTGVYFEIGYAKALGKTVILTCNKEDFECVHFDLKQTQIVVWTDENDLRIQLKRQICQSIIKG